MNFVNMGLVKADISITKKSDRHIAYPILNIYTNGLPKIGSCRLDEKFVDEGARKLDIRQGTRSAYENVEPFESSIFCSWDQKNNPILTTNTTSRYVAEKTGHTGVYLIAIPFKRKIIEIAVPPAVTIYKTCFTSVTQTKSKRPYNWPADSKNGYYKTLYVLCELDYNKLDDDVLNTLNDGDPLPGVSIFVTECGLPTETASTFLASNPVVEPAELTTTIHTMEIPLVYNESDLGYPSDVGRDFREDRDKFHVTNIDFDPRKVPVVNKKFTGIDAIAIAHAVVDKKYEPFAAIENSIFAKKQ